MSSHSTQNQGWGSGKIKYVSTFRAFSLNSIGRTSLEIGDKIILPSIALESIRRLKLPFPLLFQIKKYEKLSSNNIISKNELINEYKKRIENIYRSNPSQLNKIDKLLKKYSNNPHELYIKICSKHGIIPKPVKIMNSNNDNNNNKNKLSFGKQYCSVYEFSSPSSDSAYLPHWMMENIGVNQGDKIELESQFNIPKGTFCIIQAFKKEFMDVVGSIGYKSTLEHSLRHYSVLTINQRIVVEFNHIKYECIIKDIKPQNVVSILGTTDLEIQFKLPALDQLNNDSLSDNLSDISDISNISDINPNMFKKLGVPLDYNQQIDLANLIIQNRNKKNHTTNDTTNDTKEEKELHSVDHVKCDNCGKYIHNMSIVTHKIYCQRQFIRCNLCNKSLNKKYINKHFIETHKEFKCICNDKIVFIGEINYNIHLKKCNTNNNNNNNNNNSGVQCVLCNEYIIDSNDKLLHLLTVCKERRALCTYCGIFRKCIDMEQHIGYCGSRSEQCDKCKQFVSLMNMKPHKQSNCQWFNNNQLSNKTNTKTNVKSKNNNNNKNNNDSNDTSLFGLISNNNYSPNLCHINISNKQLCPYCVTDDTLMNKEECQIHFAIKHPKLINKPLTQTVMASFQNPNILNNNSNTKNRSVI